jgi:glycosyltransferase involved in cell wall biosynthesis
VDREVLATRLAAADIFAFPSRQEGFAVAPMEAMAAGLPVVTTDASGAVDLVGGDGGGIIVSAGDAQAFAGALGRLVDDPEERRRMGAQARVGVARRYSADTVGRQLADALIGAERG